jgi:hypothetical protein
VGIARTVQVSEHGFKLLLSPIDCTQFKFRLGLIGKLAKLLPFRFCLDKQATSNQLIQLVTEVVD